ncbi:MAG: acyltransferase [Hyphomonas sp.]|uniref:acyltransferase family protein n=1 Tax=Hyphomonas sp. TaxID=87 RepID=UPI0034A03D28
MQLNAFLPSRVFKRNLAPGSYRLEIDGLRFFAIMVVMVGHLLERIHKFWFEPNPGLDFAPVNAVLEFFASPNQGVLLFFAISGFIIAKQMQDVSLERFNSSFIGKYYIRRITRIFPPYYFVILTTFVAYYFFGLMPDNLDRSNHTEVALPQSLAASLFYAHGAVFDNLPRLFAPGWSLEVEVQFYLLAPLIFLTLFQGKDRTAFWRYALMIAVFFSVSFVVINKIVPVNAYTILSYIVYFGIGITLARFEGPVQLAFSHIGSKASLALGVTCVLGMFWLGNADFRPLAMTLVYWALSLATIVVLFGLAFQAETLFGKFCRVPYVTYIGMACYSLYLVHLQVFHIATQVAGKFVPMNYFAAGAGFAIILGVGLVAGWLFFALVEKPFSNWRPFPAKPAARLPETEVPRAG